MRTLILALCACSSGSRSEPATTPSRAEAPAPTNPAPAAPAPNPPPPSVAQLIAPEVTGILKASGAEFPIISYVSSLSKKPPACWTQLVGAVTAGYQLTVAPSAYFVFEGNLPQRDVEQCVQQALASALPITIEHDGELAVFRSKAGVVYAKWSPPFIVAGTKDQVLRAATSSTEQSRRQWTERLAQFPPGKLAMWGTDALFQNLLGVASTGYLLVVERVTKTPQPSFSARVVAQFATEGDAAIVARRIRQGELAVPNAPAELVGALKQMKVKQRAATVEVAFDSDMFYGMELDKLQQWVARLSAGTAPARK